jgi:hypothetical protein
VFWVRGWATLPSSVEEEREEDEEKLADEEYMCGGGKV